MAERAYLAGFGNQFVSEAVPGTLPLGRNSPQRAPRGLYAELISGSAFTAPRHQNQRTWVYRRQPSVVAGAYAPYAQPHWKSGAAEGEASPPDPLRWHPIAVPAEPLDFVDGLRTIAVNGDPDTQTGMAAHLVLMNRSMDGRALVNADGEMLVVPQQGTLSFVTELGVIDARPGEIVLLPRGLAFSVGVSGPSRAYVCENHGAAFRLPELGPIGSNGLANPRDFLAPVAAFEARQDRPCEIIRKSGGRLWRSTQPRTPFDVVAWHGNLAPLKYDTAKFMVIGSISFDHPDPSIFTVLTSPTDTPGTANCDFVIFPPRWMVAEGTFRPPWFHRNVMSEAMGLLRGAYDAKAEGFRPGGLSLHNLMSGHGPDVASWRSASVAELKPHKIDGTMAFMVESCWPYRLTRHALDYAQPDYDACWQGFPKAKL